jgi:hypothetical protein
LVTLNGARKDDNGDAPPLLLPRWFILSAVRAHCAFVIDLLHCVLSSQT